MTRHFLRELAKFYPETANGTLQPEKWERIFWCDGKRGRLGIVGPLDGSMVPIRPKNVSLTEENIFDPPKIQALVRAALHTNLLVRPGYGDIQLRDGELYASLRDGNHRTVAAIKLFPPVVWIQISPATKMYLNEAGTLRVSGQFKESLDALYRAIREQQEIYQVPILERQEAFSGVIPQAILDELINLETKLVETGLRLKEIAQSKLEKWGVDQSTGFSEEEQYLDPLKFWPIRMRELIQENGRIWYDENVRKHPMEQERRLLEISRSSLMDDLWSCRERAGLDPTKQRYDPFLRTVVQIH